MAGFTMIIYYATHRRNNATTHFNIDFFRGGLKYEVTMDFTRNIAYVIQINDEYFCGFTTRDSLGREELRKKTGISMTGDIRKASAFVAVELKNKVEQIAAVYMHNPKVVPHPIVIIPMVLNEQ